MRLFVALILVITCYGNAPCFAQTQLLKTSDTLVSYTWYNHASRFFEGVHHVAVTRDSIYAWKTVSRGPFISDTSGAEVEKKTSKKIDSAFIEKLRALNLDTLNDQYVEETVMLTSGNEYFVYSRLGKSTKTIWLHMYFLQSIRTLIDLLNEQLPQGYHAEYLIGPVTDFWGRK